MDRLLAVFTEAQTVEKMVNTNIGTVGLRVMLTHEQSNKEECHIYVPSLSSLYMCWDHGFTEYHEKEPLYNRLPINEKLSSLSP